MSHHRSSHSVHPQQIPESVAGGSPPSVPKGSLLKKAFYVILAGIGVYFIYKWFFAPKGPSVEEMERMAIQEQLYHQQMMEQAQRQNERQNESQVSQESEEPSDTEGHPALDEQETDK